MRGERADDPVADAEMGEGRAAAGAVIAERLLGLEHDHAPMPGQPRCRRKAGDAAADDQEVRVHGARPLADPGGAGHGTVRRVRGRDGPEFV